MSAKKSATEPETGRAGCLTMVIATVAIIGVVVFGAVSCDGDTSTTVPMPTMREATELAEELAIAEKAHGICYGWSLSDPTNHRTEVGSSRGPGVAANTCARFVEVSISVTYTSESSEAEDYASVSVSYSPDLVGNAPTTSELRRLGVDGGAAIDDPVATVGFGALALPLLLAENGVVSPVDLPNAPGATDVKPLDKGGNDLLRAHWQALAFLVGGVVVCVACLLLWLWTRRRARRREAREKTTTAPKLP